MKKILIAAFFVATGAVESHAAADGAIAQVFAQLDRCLATNDAKCVGDLFVDDGTFLAPTSGDVIVKGKSQIVKTLEALMGAPAPNLTSAKVHSVENVRMVGEAHALVDASVGAKDKAPDPAGGPGGAYRAVAVMSLEGGKWLFDDIRSYAVLSDDAAAKAVGPTPAAPKDPAVGEPAPKDPAAKDPAGEEPPAEEAPSATEG